MIRRIAQSLPTRESIQANRWLRWMGPALAHPRLWHMSRKGIAAGLALGLFFGLLVPIAQIPLAATAAVVLRANLPVAIGSTLVTNPVTFGPVYYGAYKLGDWLLHRGDGPVRSPDVLEARLQQLHEAPAPIVEANGVAGHIRAIWTRITVSKSVAIIFSFLSSISNKKSSKIGKTVLVLITPAICCKCFKREEEDTINFIIPLYLFNFSNKTNLM